MTSKTFWLKGGIIRHNVKRFWWLSAIYAFALFLCEPYMLLGNKENLLDYVENFPGITLQILAENETTFPILIGAAILLGICVFRYLQGTRSATLFHALPVNRTQLYVSGVVSGFILLAVPILLNSFILLLMNLFLGFAPIFTPLQLVDWVGSQLLTGMATMCFTIFVGIFTGSSVAQIIYVFVLSFIPLGVAGLASELLDGWLFGFTSAAMNPTLELFLKMVPMYYPQYLTADPVWWIPPLAGVYILVFGGLGLFFYHKRHTERAGDVVAFSWIRPIFLYGVTFCVMLLGTSFFTEISGTANDTPSVWIMLLFALVGYVVAKMLILKSFRIFKYYKGYVVFGVLVLLAYFAVNGNIFGFGTNVPATDEIEKAYVGDFLLVDWAEREPEEGSRSEGAAIFREEAEIDMVRALHKDWIEAGKPVGAERLGTQTLYVAYQLTSGRKIVRAYEGLGECLHPIFDTDAAKDSMFPNFRLHPENIRYIAVMAGAPEDRTVYDDELQELIGCVRADLDRLSYREITDRFEYRKEIAAGTPASMKVIYEDKMVDTYSMEVGLNEPSGVNDMVWFQFNENFTETVNWLRAKGYLGE